MLLQLAAKSPDHIPDNPYSLEEIYQAVTLRLYGTSLQNINAIVDGCLPITSTIPTIIPTSSVVKQEDNVMKREDFLVAMEQMTQSFTNALRTMTSSSNNSNQRPQMNYGQSGGQSYGQQG